MVNGASSRRNTVWARDHSYDNAHLPTVIGTAGVDRRSGSLWP